MPASRKKRRNLPWFFIILFSIFAIVIVLAFITKPDFDISVNPESISIQKGSFGTLWVKLISKNGFDSEVSFDISGEPSGVITTLDRRSVSPPKDGSITLIISIKVSESASTGTSTLTITGKSGSLSHSITFLLTIDSPHGVNIVSHNSFQFSGVSKYYYIVGEVQNNERSNIKDVMITATLYYENKVVVTGFTYSMIDILLPGQKSPFEISFEYNGPVDYYSLNTSYILTPEIPYRNFALQVIDAETDDLGYYRLTGEVNNTGTQVVYWAKVVATFYDRSGKVVMVDFRYVNPLNPSAPFNPGTVLPFNLSTIPQKITPASYAIQVQGKVE
jgi:hypothetical protein